MKRIIACLVAVALLLTGCGQPLRVKAENETYKVYPTYGAFNSDQYHSDKVCYETSVLSVIVGVIFFETVIVPIYIFGWDVMEPVRMKRTPDDQCKAVD